MVLEGNNLIQSEKHLLLVSVEKQNSPIRLSYTQDDDSAVGKR